MDYTGFYNRVNKIAKCHSIVSNSIDVKSPNQAQEIHTDINVKNIGSTTIWGRLTDINSKPLAGQCVQLIKNVKDTDGRYLEVVGYTVTDQDGYYELNAYEEGDEEYNILVSCKEVNETVFQDVYTHTPLPNKFNSLRKQDEKAYNKNIQPYKGQIISSYVKFYG